MRAAVCLSPSHITRRPLPWSAVARATLQAAHALERADWLLAGRVDVEHPHLVSGRERLPELLCEGFRPRVEVGLKDGDQPPGPKLAERGERGTDLRRMMGVVVVDQARRSGCP